jgi:hypothetical protein
MTEVSVQDRRTAASMADVKTLADQCLPDPR